MPGDNFQTFCEGLPRMELRLVPETLPPKLIQNWFPYVEGYELKYVFLCILSAVFRLMKTIA